MPPDGELTLLMYFGIYVNENFPFTIRMKASAICLKSLIAEMKVELGAPPNALGR
jgi:hypothetical protein